MKNSALKVGTLALSLVLSLAACSQPSVSPTPTPSVSPTPAPTPAPSDTPTLPAPFAFVTLSAPPGATVESNTITVTGLSQATIITASAGTLLINGTPVSGPTTVNNGDTVQLRLQASATPGHQVRSTVAIGLLSATFTVITGPTGAATITPALAVVLPGEVLHLSTPTDAASLGLRWQLVCSSQTGNLPVDCASLTVLDPQHADFTGDIPGTYVVNLVDANGGVAASNVITVKGIKVTLSADRTSAPTGQDVHLSASLKGSTQGGTWSVTPSAGATLTQDGVNATFSASAPGEYVLTFTSKEDGRRTNTITITVRQVDVSNVTASPNPMALNTHTTLSATVTGSTQGVTYAITGASGGGDVTKASITGSTFTASQVGTYTITATSNEDPTKSASTQVVVLDLPPVIIYYDSYFNGPSQALYPGVYSAPNGDFGPVGDNLLSSIRVPAGYTVVACDDPTGNPNVGVGCRTYTTDLGFDYNGTNDTTSYLRITYSGPTNLQQ